MGSLIFDPCSSSRGIRFHEFPLFLHDIALNNVDKAGNYLDTGIEIVFALLGRRILDGKSGVQGEISSPVSIFHRSERNKAAVFYLYATTTSE